MEYDSYKPQEMPDARQQSEQPHRVNQGDASVSPISGIPSILSTFGLGKAIYFADTQQAVGALDNQEWAIRVAAVRALGKMGERAPVDALVTALSDEHEAVRAAAARSLGIIGEHAPIAPLVMALNDSSWHVRSASVMTLGKMGERAPLAPLMMALNDKDESVRAAAVWALSKQGEQAPIAAFANALHDPAWSVREAATLILSQIPQVQYPENRSRKEQATDQPDVSLYQLDTSISKRSNDFSSTPSRTAEQETELQSPAQTESEMARKPQAALIEHNIFSIFQRKHRSESIDQNDVDKGRRYGKPLSFEDGTVRVQVHSTGKQTRTKQNAARPGRLRIAVSIAERSLIAAVLIGIMLATWFTFHQRQPQPAGYEQPIIFNTHTKVKEIEWASDQHRLLLADMSGGLQVWDMTTKQLTRINGDFSQILATSWRGNDLYLATLATNGTRGEITIEQINDELTTRALMYYPVTVPTSDQTPVAAFWSDGQNVRLAVGSADGKVQVYDVITHTQIQNFPTDTQDYQGKTVRGYVTALAWTHDGTRLATAIDDSTRVVNNIYLQEWDAATGTPVDKSDKDVSVKVVTMAWSPDGTYLVHGSQDGNVGLWYPKGAKETQITNVYSSLHPSFLPTLAWSQDSARFATTTSNGGVQIWDTAGNPVRYYPAYAQINDVTWSPDGRYLAWANADGTIQVQPVQ
jgi:WD40 repeat protein